MSVITRLSRRLESVLGNGAYAVAGDRTRPECVVLSARSNITPSHKPAVRIFLGTEPAQYRAERVFLWSIEQFRDPSRVYEIYLMKELAGFHRRGWLTGFTNYRFAIPHFADGQGRAIYNDTDQIYLADPGELFDTDLAGHGYLSVHERDTSVMLIDCERMYAIWTLDAARRKRRGTLEADAHGVVGVWGRLTPDWNVRDDEFIPGRTKILHFTTIHAQPWQPFPERYAYQHNPTAAVWFDLERAVDKAGYHVFKADRPSTTYYATCDRLARLTALSDPDTVRQERLDIHTSPPTLKSLLRKTNSRSVLHYSFGMRPPVLASHGPQSSPDNGTYSDQPAGQSADGVVCAGALDFFPDEDVPWMLEELFRRAYRFVYVTTGALAYVPTLPNGGCLPARARPSVWWRTHLDTLSFRYPHIYWYLELGVELETWTSTALTGSGATYSGGNLWRHPLVWVLTSHKPGTTTQALGLADALGWPYTTKTLYFRGSARLQEYFVGTHRPTLMGLDTHRSDALDPPWPDLIITAGWQSARVARWVQQQNEGRTHLVVLGRKGSHPIRPTDISVTCDYFCLPPHPRRIRTPVPLTRVSQQRLLQAAEEWQQHVQGAPHPWIALLIGGTTPRHKLGSQEAKKIGMEVRAFAERGGGTVFASTSRRTGKAATEALTVALGPLHRVYAWQSDRLDNPYLGYLALADILIVTGDSESMLAEAAATDKPFYIYRLPEISDGTLGHVKDWMLTQAQNARRVRRGSIQPQRGLSYWCARLIERDIVRPRRNLNALYAGLIRAGVARYFNEAEEVPAGLSPRPALHVFDEVVRQVLHLLAFRIPDSDQCRDDPNAIS